MKGRKYWEIGGFLAGGVLVVFGVVAIFLGVSGYRTVHDELNQQYIVGSDDMTPAAIQKEAKGAGLESSISLPTCDVAGSSVDNGAKARCFAQYMRIHTLEATGGLTYAQMGRYQSAAKADDPAGTNDTTAAAKDATGQPVSNGARNIWVTETALTTALNTSYMAERLAIFGIVVGIALLLSGLGFVILAFAVFGLAESRKEAVRAVAPTPSAAT
jgi:hypothetical protein